jgi:glycosyltransferase involved in cell wall biosynthesis
MNIIYIHQHFSTARGHTGTRSYDFARRLAARGHRVTVVTGVYGASDLAEETLAGGITRRVLDGIDLRIINIRHDNKQAFWSRVVAFLAFMAASTIEVLRIGDADVVFATSTPLTTGVPGTLAHWLRRVPFVFEVRDIWPDVAVEVGALTNPVLIAAARLAERTFYRAAARIVVIGERMAVRLRQRVGKHAAKVCVIPLGTDYALFAGAEPDADWRRRHGLEGKFVAVYAGAHGRVNAVGWVIKAAAMLRGDPRVRFAFIGDGVLKDSLRAEAEAQGLANVLWLDPLPKESLARVLKTCDLGLMTVENLSIYDTAFPNKFMDYLAAGLPVLVNLDCEAGRVCVDEACGVVVPPEDPRAMASSIAELAGDPSRCRRMGARAQTLAAARFDRSRLVLDLEEVLLAATRKGRSAMRSQRA